MASLMQLCYDVKYYTKINLLKMCLSLGIFISENEKKIALLK